MSTMSWLKAFTVSCILAFCHLAWACQYDQFITREAMKLGVPPEVAITICHAESGGNAQAIGDHGTTYGLFQIRRSLWIQFTMEHRDVANSTPAILLNPANNIACGVWNLSLMKKTADPRNYLSWHNAGIQDWRTLKPAWSVNHPNLIYKTAYRRWRPGKIAVDIKPNRTWRLSR